MFGGDGSIEKKGTSGGKIFFIILGIIALLAIIGTILYFTLFKKPKPKPLPQTQSASK